MELFKESAAYWFPVFLCKVVCIFKGFFFLCQISDMEQGEGMSPSPRPEPKLDKKKAEKAEVPASSSDKRDLSLHVEDLDNPPLSPVPDSHSSRDE